MENLYYVYIMASLSKNLYVGVTNNLLRRVMEHKEGRIRGFTSRYGVHRLVYLESFRDVRTAIACEKRIKSWRRDKKIALIEKINPTWQDLGSEWTKAGAEERKVQIPRRQCGLGMTS